MTLVGSRNATREDFDLVASSIRSGKVARPAAHAPRDLARWAHEKSGLIKAIIKIGN